MNYQNILTQQKQGIFSITINRPEKLNALNKATLAELHQALHQALADAQTGAILITGAGDKAFVAGADIKELAALQATEAKAFAKKIRTRCLT
ncbi:enoyl-CoA hydratase-related protein [Pelobium manganitolerans]|uniref:enoyl-CoA hydratase-related protein n=1 Tax=Pelobium manganitolerans TaxID=1842495 RepID=UPI00267D981F|nr:enoyl-CoA hydratase-related protein [Pelobium manganitolerans]